MNIPVTYAHGGPFHEFESDPGAYESPNIQQAPPVEVVLVVGAFLLLAIGTFFLVKRKQK